MQPSPSRLPNAVKWFKSLLILCLAVLCVFQAGLLWFGGAPRLDLMAILQINRPPDGFEEAMMLLARPRRMLLSYGGNVFFARYSLVQESEEFAKARAVIYDLLLEDESPLVVTSEEPHWRRYLEQAVSGTALVLDYGFSLPSGAFTAAFSSESTAISSQIESFDMVIFAPGEEAPTRVIFVDNFSPVQRAVEFVSNARLEYMDVANRHNIVYIATLLADIDTERLTFFPMSLGGGIYYTTIRQEDHISATEGNIRDTMLPFFDNPAIVRSEVSHDSHIFKENTYSTASFRQGHYIDFRSWRTRGGRTVDSLQAAFAEAMIFMAARDTMLENEVYLHWFSYENGVYRLYFNYIYDNIPVILAEPLREELGMDAFIEITFENGRLSHYKRHFILVESRQDVGERRAVSYQNALDLLIGYPYTLPEDIVALDMVFIIGIRNAANLGYSLQTRDETHIIIAR